MKFIKENLTVIVLMAVIVILLLMWFKRPVVQTNYAEITKAYEETFKAKDELIGHLKKDNAELSAEIVDKKRQDSVLLFTLIANQTKYKANDKKLQDVVSSVSNATKDELRRIVAEY